MADPKKPEKKERVVKTARFLQGKASNLVPHDEKGLAKYPTLHEALLAQYEDGELSRQPGVLRLTQRGPLYRVTIVCPTEVLQTTVEVESLAGLLEAVELHLRDPRAIWEAPYDPDAKRDLPVIQKPIG